MKLSTSSKQKVRLMFEDEASFGRINKPKYCWCKKGIRPCVPCRHIREYRYVYGAVDPISGDSLFEETQRCNTLQTYFFLKELSRKFKNDIIILVMDGASWHKNKDAIPENIHIIHLPPATPEMNPIEQIWKELRKIGFRNEIFSSLEKVMECLRKTIKSISNDTVKSITGRQWILDCF